MAESIARSSGGHATALIAASCRRLVELQAPVLADQDPEPLHQMRVALRRLRTGLRQFAPALVMPPGVSDRRIAKIGRRLGLARDLDVLQAHLRLQLLPQLPEEEVQALRPVLKQLRRERRLAREQLVDGLRSGGYLKLLAELQAWLRAPRFTPLGQEPLAGWQVEWALPMLAGLFSHPGWFVDDPSGDLESLHDLRKRCKGARYALANLRPLLGDHGEAWLDRFRQVQDLLGELHDLQVLQRAIDDQLPGRLTESLPQLDGLLQQRTRGHWAQWRQQAAQLQQPDQRRRLLLELLEDSRPALMKQGGIES